MVLVTSLDLDQLEDGYEEKQKKTTKNDELFEYEDDADPTFDINRIDRFFSRDAPDFVIFQNFLFCLINFLAKGRKMYQFNRKGNGFLSFKINTFSKRSIVLFKQSRIKTIQTIWSSNSSSKSGNINYLIF